MNASIHNGSSPAVHDRATEVVATGSARTRNSRKAAPMNTTHSSTPHLTERALVLGGGGSAGNAWLIGVVAGLFDTGLDVTTADLTVGTSAGSTAAAQLAGATPTELLDAILAADPHQRTGSPGSDRGRVPSRPVVDHLERMRKLIASAEDAADLRRRVGAAAIDLDAEPDGSWQAQWRATVAARLPESALAETEGAHHGGRCRDRSTGRIRPPQRSRAG